MKKFSFRLESVLKLRRFDTDKAKIELQKVLAEKVERLNTIADYDAEIDKMNETKIKDEKNIFAIQSNYHRKRFIDQQKSKLRKEILNIEEIEKVKRENLAEYLKKEKALEKYKEKKYEEFKYLANKEENDMIDEIALRKFIKTEI